MAKPKLALYWAASCGGCEIAVLEVGEKILDVAEAFDIVFWPVALDIKYQDLGAMPDASIDLCLFNGAIRTTENEHLAHLLRKKSVTLVAFGSCAMLGGIPALANFSDREGIFRWVYLDSPSTHNQDTTTPQTVTRVPEGELSLPQFYDTVRTLAQVVPVEYFVPGCPPVAEQIANVLFAYLERRLPPPGAVVGATAKTLCDECPRVKEKKQISGFVRPHLFIPEPERCLLEQGLVCAGPATRGGCGARCILANMPCRGCYGPPEGVVDQGARLLSALASIVDSDDPEEIRRITQGIVDPVGTFYRFGMAGSLFRRRRIPGE